MARRRRRQNPVMPTFADVLPTLLLLGVAWVIYRKLQTPFSAATATAGEKVANAVEWFFPTLDQRSLMTYAVQFPDGRLHAVAGESIDGDGNFTWTDGRAYQLAGKTAAGNFIAKRIV